jgi:hypothetical protein
MSDLFVDNIKHQSSQGSGTITIGASGESVTVPNGSLTGQNYPAFEANRATDLSFTNNVTQKITYDTEIFDTNGYYDNATNYRFTPLIAGKYYVYASLTIQASTDTTLNLAFLEIHKNGTKYRGTMNNMNTNFITALTPYVGTVIDMNGSTDYIEVYVRPTVSSGTVKSQGADNVFGAYRIGA